MPARLVNKLRWSFRKNWPDVKGILLRHYPDFVLSDRVRDIGEQVPVFVFHSVTPGPFRAQLAYLQENGYTTLNSDELLQVMTGKMEAPAKAVVLTFDDGTASLYSVAKPLLEQFGFCAISFIIPGCIPETAPHMPTYTSEMDSTEDADSLLERERSDYPLCSWEEIKELHNSGTIDFQAHTMYHHLIFVGRQLVDFLHPKFDTHFYANVHVPVYYNNGRPDFTRKIELGAPVYRAEPRMSGKYQYYDDQKLRESCIRFVRENGGEAFFKQKKWRKELTAFYNNEVGSGTEGRYETPIELRQAIYEDLVTCRAIIEKRLNKKVEHFCFPWFIGSEAAMESAVKAGYKGLYWGLRSDTKINLPGGDPLRFVRLEDRFIFRLPGRGRKTITELLLEKASLNLPLRGDRSQTKNAVQPA